MMREKVRQTGRQIAPPPRRLTAITATAGNEWPSTHPTCHTKPFFNHTEIGGHNFIQ